MLFQKSVLNDIKNLVTKKEIMQKYNMNSNIYKKYYAEFLRIQKDAKSKRNYKINEPSERIKAFSQESLLELLDLKDKEGVYLLYKDEKIVYVGVSSDLKTRIPRSINDKSNINGFSYICTDSLSDAYILEVLLINIIKPCWNGQSLGYGSISFEVPEKYEYKDLYIFR